MAEMTEGMKFQIASLGMSIVAFGTFLLVDWYLPETTIVSKAAVPLVGVGAICHAWSAPLSAVAGRAYFPDSWNFFQPFEGSQVFQLHQALGWTLYGICLLAISFTVVDLNGGRHPKGETTLIGIIGLVSQLLLSHSFNFFSPSTVKAQRRKKIVEHENDLIKRTTLLQNPRTWISVLLTVVSTVVLFFADEQESSSGAVFLGRLATAGHLCAAFVTHILIGVVNLPNYRIFMPFSGGYEFLLLQSFAWLFVGILANVSLLLPAVLRYGVTSTGKKMAALGVAAQSLLLVSLLYFHQTSHDSASHASYTNSLTGRLFAISRGSSLWTISFCLLPWSAVLLMGVIAMGEDVSDVYLGGKNTMSALAIVVMMSTAPLAHWSGKGMYKTYQFWQPFEGGSKYFYAQGLGWTSWGISLTLWIVYNLNTSELFTFADALTGLVPVCFLSSGLLIGSVLYFEEKNETVNEEEDEEVNNERGGVRGVVDIQIAPTLDLDAGKARGRRRSARIRAASEKKKKSNGIIKKTKNTKKRGRTKSPRKKRSSSAIMETNKRVWYGNKWSNEEYLTFLLACANQILCIATDMARQDTQNRIGTPLVFFWISYFGILFVPFLVIMAGMKKWNNFKIFQPFIGGTTFVAWQAIGWTLYSAGFLLHSVLLAIPEIFLSGDRVSEWPLMFTIAGLPSLVAHCMLIFSITKFVPEEGITISSVRTSSPPCSPIHSPRRHSPGTHSPGTHSPRQPTGENVLDLKEAEEDEGRERASKMAQIVSIIIALASIILPVIVDTLVHQKNTAANNNDGGPMYVLFVYSCVGSFFGAFFTHMICGFLLHPRTYTFFQPFRGGIPFIMLQAIGWSLIGCGGIGTLMIIEIGGPTKTPFFGIITVLGIVFFFGQITLLSSLRWYYDDELDLNNNDGNDGNDDSDNDKYSKEIFSITLDEEKKNRSVIRRAILSVTLCIGGLFLFTFADYALLQYGPSFPTGPLIVCGIVAVCGSVPISWLLSGPSSHNHKFTLIGTFGWALWSFTVMLGAWTLLNMATSTTAFIENNFTDNISTNKIIDSATVDSTSATGSTLSDSSLSYESMSTSTMGSRTTRSSRIASIFGIIAQGLLALSVLKPPSPNEKNTPKESQSRCCHRTTSTIVFFMVTFIRTTIRIIGPINSVVLCTIVVLWRRLFIFHSWLVSIFGWNIVSIVVIFLSLSIFPIVTSITIRLWMKKILMKIWHNYLESPTGIIATFIGYWLILPCLRIWLDWPAWFYHYWWFHHGNGHVSQDGLPVGLNTKIIRNKRYGVHDLELLNIYEPISYDGLENRGPLMFVHGGGWVAVNREVMGQSITPFVRAGFTVYSIDYPLAPESKYPGPLISVIRACAWVKRYSQSKTITLVGDSAGGNLATMAAALLSNSHLLNDMNKRIALLNYPMYETIPITEWNLPIVKQVVSMYGVVDQKAWRSEYPMNDNSFIMWLMWEGTSKVLSFCFDCYSPLPLNEKQMHRSLNNEKNNENEKEPDIDVYNIGKYLTLGDYCDDQLITSYPPTLLICGVGDPLVLANRKVQQLLNNITSINLLEFPGPHAFHGIPPQWTLDGWRSNSYPTTREMLLFLTNGELVLPNSTIFQPPDWSLPIVLLAHVAIVIGLMVQAIEVFLE
jgi:acetyl esterase/lipase